MTYRFEPSRLNLLLTGDDLLKEELFAALCQTLGGYSPAFEAQVKESNLQADFREQIVEFEQGELKSSGEESALGVPEQRQELELQKQLLQELYLQRGADEQETVLDSPEARLSIFARVYGISEKTHDIEIAVKALSEKLSSYPFKDKNYKIEDLLNGMYKGKALLTERMVNLEAERRLASKNMEELKTLELELEKTERRKKRQEYFQLCLSTAELDGRIMKLQTRLLNEAELKRELAALSELADFPIASARKVQELWTVRQARLSDLERLKEDLREAEHEWRKLEEKQELGPADLGQYTIEDAQELYGLAKSIQSVREELEQIRLNRDAEMRNVKTSGVDFDSISLIRKTLLSFLPEDFELAKELAAEFKRQKERLTDLALNSKATAKQLSSLSNELSTFKIKSRRIRLVLSALACISAAIVISVFLSGPWQTFEVFATIFMTTFVLSLVALSLLPSLLTGMRKDFELREESLTKQQQELDATELALSHETSEIQKKAEELAGSYKLASSVELFKKLQQYDSISTTLKQLDLLDHMLAAREQHLKKLYSEGESYLQRLKRNTNIITVEALSGLASEILRFKEDTRELERRQSVLNHRKTELRFLEGEIQDLDGILKDFFVRARIDKNLSMEGSFAEFEQKVLLHKKWENIKAELKRMSTDITSEIFEHDLATVVSKLQHKRTDAWSRMQDLIALYPEILSETLEDSELGKLGQEDSAEDESRYEEMRSRREELLVSIKTAISNFDEFHPKTEHELEIMERQISRIEHDKQALALALSCVKQVAQESKSRWSQELCSISKELLSELSIELSELSWNDKLEFLVLLKDGRGPLEEGRLSREVAYGLYKQIRCLAGLTIYFWLSQNVRLPLILEEPFSDLNDSRFKDCLRLLVERISPKAQTILLSSQPARYGWFLESLSQEERGRIHLLS